MEEYMGFPIINIGNYSGFIDNGNIYIELEDAMSILGYKYYYNGTDIRLWSKMHKEFYSTMNQLRINKEDYPIPLVHKPASKSSIVSKYEIDLPAYVMDKIILTIAGKKRDESCTLFEFNSLITKFKDPRRIAQTEMMLENCRSLGNFSKNIEEESELNNMKKDKNNDINKIAEASAILPKNNFDILQCPLENNLVLNGFIDTDNMIFVNSLEVGFMIGMTKVSSKNPNINIIKWDEYYKAYTNTIINLPVKYSKYYTFESKFRDASSKRGQKSKYEQMMPEFIPLIVAYAVANSLYNSRASYFRLQVILYALPFFLNNAPKDQQDKIDFVKNVRPLLDERDRQIQAERERQNQIALQQQQQYQQFMLQQQASLMYFNNFNQLNTGFRPAIPGYDFNSPFTGMAYVMPTPENIQKNLDSQPKDRIDVVRFENPNKKEDDGNTDK